MKKSLILLFLTLFCIFRNVNGDEPIVFNTLQKTASVYIAHKLAKGLDKQIMTISNNVAPMCHIKSHKLKELIQSNKIAREHLAPTQENIELLKRHSLKMIFHVRDLRQRVVSLAHYHLDYVQRNNEDTIAFYKRNGSDDVENWALDDFFEHHIEGVKDIVKTIDGWLKVYEEGTIPILITSFEEFHDDERSFFGKILDFYNIPKWKFKDKYVPKDFHHKFRKGEKEEWRTVLTYEQIQRINAQIPDEYFSFFGWNRL